MPTTWTWAMGLITAGIVGILLTQIFAKKPKIRTNTLWVGAGMIILGAAAMWVFPSALSFLLGPIGFGGTNLPDTPTWAVTGNNGGGNQVNLAVEGCSYQPTGTYAALDAFTAATIGGTAYEKEGSNKIASGTLASLKKGTSYQYWVSNATTYIQPMSKTADCGTNTFQATGYQNGSMTIAGYDIVGDAKISDSANNISMGANDNAKVKLTVAGSAKTSAMPLGGVMVVEANSTISSIACSGDGIVGLNNKYQVTYTPTATTTRNVVYEVAPGFDLSKDGGNTGVTNVIRCDFTNGASAAGAGSAYYVKFIPANYYIGNDGNLYLDVEQKMNGATTRTGLGSTSATFYWAA